MAEKRNSQSSVRLYFFPALLPLASVLPWLLTAVGFLASLFSRIIKKVRYQKIFFLSGVSLLIAGFTFFAWNHYHLRRLHKGTRLLTQQELPHIQIIKKSSKNRKPAETHGDLFFQFTKNKILSNIAIQDGRLFAGTWEGSLDVFSSASGDLLWTVKKKEPILSEPAISNKFLLVGEGLHTSETSSLTAIDVIEKKILWQREFLGHLEAKPLIDANQNQTWISTGPSGIWSLELKTGKVLWQKKIGHSDSTPYFDGKNLYIASQPDETKKESKLFCLDAKTGEIHWSLLLPGQPWGTPKIVESEKENKKTLYLTTALGQLGPLKKSDKGWSHAVNIKKKQLLWSSSLSSMPLMESEYDASLGLVFHTLKNGEVLALKMQSGHSAWVRNIKSEIRSAPTLTSSLEITASKKELLVLDYSGTLYFLSSETGKTLKTLQVGPQSTSRPAVLGNKIYIASPGQLFAYGI